MSLQDHPKSLRDHPAVVIITLVLAAAGLFFTVGYNTRGDRIASLEAQIKTFEMSKSMKLGDLLASLRTASEALKKDVSIANELQLAKKKISEQAAAIEAEHTKNNQLRMSLEKSQSQLTEKQKLLESIFLASQSFRLNRGEAKQLAGYGVIVGLVDTNYGDKSMTASVNNEKLTMLAESVKALTANGRKYRLIVTGIDFGHDAVDFDFVVDK